MKTIQVELGEQSYSIVIAPGGLARIGEFASALPQFTQTVVITNEAVNALYGDTVIDSLEQGGHSVARLVIPEGERFKSLETFADLVTGMLKHKLDRHSAVVALGGGVVGDLAGYTAAAFMRGIPWINLPTSLLAQVDASIGGKVGVNHSHGKNLIGAFHQPRLVLIDPECLQSLPARELLCGMAEVIKHALIADRGYFNTVRDEWQPLLNHQSTELTEIIARSCEIKSAIVTADEKEQGRRALLNFGHSVGHALEAASGYGILKHGEAVLIGMLAEAMLANRSGSLSDKEFEQIDNFLRSIPLSVSLARISTAEVQKFISVDKKNVAGKTRMVLLQSIGEAELTSEWDRGSLSGAISYAASSFGLDLEGL